MLEPDEGVGWRVFYTRRRRPLPTESDGLAVCPAELDAWLDRNSVLENTPFLIDPEGRYDVALNRFFLEELSLEPLDTQRAYASDLKLFLQFLWASRGRKDWREAVPDDRRAYKQWRTKDPRGPRVKFTTWDREVATVNQFYLWAVRNAELTGVRSHPVRQREARNSHPHARSRAGSGTTVPAESSHTGPANDTDWMPPGDYRRWRDVGLLGFTAGGLPSPSFRGRFGSRNATYSDLMIRTGLRLSEQTSLSLFELPRPEEMGPGQRVTRFWLPAEIAKNGSARHVYLQRTLVQDIWDFVELERIEAVERARSRGLYDQIYDPLIVEDPERARPFAMVHGNRRYVADMDHDERRRLLIRTDDGLEPAALWLNRDGLPSGPSAWQEVFKAANDRCAKAGLRLLCHPHKLRHSFAVILLEQLWRGHIQELAEMTARQRQTFQMVFGDPLNWVRMRLGHKSIETTLIYLHTLQELEMHTRMALIPDDWEAAGVHPEDLDEEAVVLAHAG